MFIITYNKNSLLGGYGDRLVGLISVKVMSNLLHRDFYILWNKEDINKYIDYKKYDFNLVDKDKVNKGDCKIHNYIDKQKGLKEYLMNETKLFPRKINFFVLNQEISQYLYTNELFKTNNYINDIFNEYKKLYTDILIPTDYLMEKITSLTEKKKNIVGIQVRCGDRFMKTRMKETHQTNNHIDIQSKLTNIKTLCDEKFNDDYTIFFTTDNINIVDDAKNIFGESKILYNDDMILHIDRSQLDNNLSKVFADHYILSQKTDLLFISRNSNYGRTAALSCNHDNIYDFSNCDKIEDKKRLLTNGELIF